MTRANRGNHMIGTTGLKELEISCIVGIHERERTQPQPVIFNVEVDYDFVQSAGSDKIDDAIDYDQIAAVVTDLVRQQSFALLETMAEEAVAVLFKRIERIRTIRIEIRKPQAIPDAAYSFVRVERSR